MSSLSFKPILFNLSNVDFDITKPCHCQRRRIAYAYSLGAGATKLIIFIGGHMLWGFVGDLNASEEKEVAGSHHYGIAARKVDG